MFSPEQTFLCVHKNTQINNVRRLNELKTL